MRMDMSGERSRERCKLGALNRGGGGGGGTIDAREMRWDCNGTRVSAESPVASRHGASRAIILTERGVALRPGLENTSSARGCGGAEDW